MVVMSYNENVKIIAFVGLAGAGKTAAVDYLTEKNIPKVTGASSEQIDNLVSAGQHIIVEDGLANWQDYKRLKEEFHHNLTVVAVIAPRHLRHHRLTIRPLSPIAEAEASARDWQEIEEGHVAGPIAIADRYIMNDGSEEAFYEKIDDLLEELNIHS